MDISFSCELHRICNARFPLGNAHLCVIVVVDEYCTAAGNVPCSQRGVGVNTVLRASRFGL